MARSTRVVYRRIQGRARINFNWDAITGRSAVVITAAECDYYGNRPILAEADVYVTNVGPHDPEGGPDGGVEFHLHVDWPTPLHAMVTITVFDDVEQVDFVGGL
jgi:hypothetical protein